MKKLIFSAMMFLIGICANLSAGAQNRQVRQVRFEGHGYATIKAQRENDPEVVKTNCEKFLFGTPEESATIIRSRIDGKPIDYAAVSQQAVEGIADQMHEPFYQDRKGEYDVHYDVYYTNTKAWTDFCENHEDAYFVLGGHGEIIQRRGDPETSWASQNKDFRVVATITHITTGAKAMIFADCLNAIFTIHETVIRKAARPLPSAPIPYSAPPAITSIRPQPCTASDFHAIPVRLITRSILNNNGIYTVTLKWKSRSQHEFTITDSTDNRIEGVVPGFYDKLDVHPDVETRRTAKVWDVRYVLTGCDNLRLSTIVTVDTRTWFGRNKAVWIPALIGIVGGGVACYLKKQHDHSYNNKWVHDSNTSPWTPGSGGDTPNGPTLTIPGRRAPMIGTSFSFHLGH
ncbi:MAG TPA: hypothetical protein VL576_01345 [Candidatus Paceibacterota bacterium]|jgi:hypothetical protein|nr:hypothetical protein [Candidatus Paceibacterota bacterium]